MKYILANNATATLSALLTVAATSATLANVSTTLATALGQVDANNRILLTLADAAETVHEIVEVTAWDVGTSTATITRAQDGTTAAEWAAETTAEIRAGKRQLELLFGGTGLESSAYGINAAASAPYASAIGSYAESYAEEGIAIGDALVQSAAENSISVGRSSWVNAINSVALGYGAGVNGGDSGVAVGASARADGIMSTALGAHAQAIDHTMHLAGICVQRNASSLPSVAANDIATRHRSAPLVSLASGVVVLTDGTATAQIELPAGTHFFPDRIDVIITGVNTPGGSPAITVGTTAGGTDILAATAITKNAAQQRQKISPDSDNGVSDIHISVTTAGTGTTYNCRVIVTGYLVEDE